MQYDAYVFDLYGTLVDIRTDEEKEFVWEKLSLFYRYYEAKYTAGELKEAYRTQIGQLEERLREEQTDPNVLAKQDDAHESCPEIQIEDVFAGLFEAKGVKADRALAIHAGQFFRALSTEYVKLYDGAKELLSALKKTGSKVYLLSNAQRIFTEYELRSVGILELFDGVLISSDCACKKPDPKFYSLLRERFQIDPKRAIMIGNDPIADVKGAREAGMDTFYIHSNISPEWKGDPDATYLLKEMDLKRVQEILFEIRKEQDRK